MVVNLRCQPAKRNDPRTLDGPLENTSVNSILCVQSSCGQDTQLAMVIHPVVTFLVYCAGEGRYLQQAVTSILQQQFIDHEILLLDDGSSAALSAEASALALQDGRVRHVLLENARNRWEALNQGIGQAQGDLLWFFSAMDALASPQALQDYVTEFLLTPRLGLVFCRAQCVDANGVPYEKYVPHKKNSMLPYQPTLYPSGSLFTPLLRENLMPESGVLLRKQCLERTGLLNPALHRAACWHIWTLVSLDWILYFDPNPRVYQRLPMSQVGMPTAGAIDGETRLLHYQALERFLTQRHYPAPFIRRTRLAQLQLKQKLGLPLSAPEKLFRWLRFLALR